MAASPPTVGCVNTARGETSTPNSARIREASRMLRIESPPNSKKLSSAPTRSAPSTSAQIRASARSASVRGSRYPSVGRPASGAGSALRSSLPLALSGNRSSATNAAGTM